MSLLYVNDSGATIGIEGNCCTVKQKDGSKRMLPIESLDGITIMGQSQMTTQCAEECMQILSSCTGFLEVTFQKVVNILAD